jgi:site-specific recombinase XerD
MAFLTVEGLKHLLKQPDIQTKYGRRDLALLGLLYDSGARVQELINLTPADLRFEETTTVKFIGKGNKVRIVPLSSPQVQNLRRYMMENSLFEAQNKIHPLFPNPQNNRLSRVAILDLVKKYADMARKSAPDLIPDNTLNPQVKSYSIDNQQIMIDLFHRIR